MPRRRKDQRTKAPPIDLPLRQESRPRRRRDLAGRAPKNTAEVGDETQNHYSIAPPHLHPRRRRPETQTLILTYLHRPDEEPGSPPPPAAAEAANGEEEDPRPCRQGEGG